MTSLNLKTKTKNIYNYDVTTEGKGKFKCYRVGQCHLIFRIATCVTIILFELPGAPFFSQPDFEP